MDQMLSYAGDIVTITKIISSVVFDDLLFYKIKEDNEEFLWTDEMFENNEHLCYFESLI